MRSGRGFGVLSTGILLGPARGHLARSAAKPFHIPSMVFHIHGGEVLRAILPRGAQWPEQFGRDKNAYVVRLKAQK